MRIYKAEGSLYYKSREDSSFYKNQKYKLETLEGFMKDGVIVEAMASKCDQDLNLYFDLGKDIYGIIPRSEVEYRIDKGETRPSAILNKVSKAVCFKVINIETDEAGKTKVTLSRKQAQKECYDNYVSHLRPGQVINARITHIEDYGVFCDIGCGLIALLPVEHFCVAKIREPKKDLMRFKNLKVIVRDIDDKGRLILSQKELLGTWEEEAAKFKTGDTVAGKVRLVEDYGIFVEITPNLVGLAEPMEGVEVGDTVTVFIKSIIVDKMKVKLLIVDHSEPKKDIYIKLDYRTPEDKKISYWRYSPANATKVIETVIKQIDSDEISDDEDCDIDETSEALEESATDLEIE